MIRLGTPVRDIAELDPILEIEEKDIRYRKIEGERIVI
jgi:hypothetical protein